MCGYFRVGAGFNILSEILVVNSTVLRSLETN